MTDGPFQDEDQKKEIVREWLTHILDKTANAPRRPGGDWSGTVMPANLPPVPGYGIPPCEVGTARHRQMLDNEVAGRLDWQSAHELAARGLQELDNGNTEWAYHLVVPALWSYARGLEKRLRPSDFEELGRPSKKRGRAPKIK